MFKFLLNRLLLSLFFILSACATYNGVPKAINKPQKLQLGDRSKMTAPIEDVQKQALYSSYPETSETIRKLFDFSSYKTASLPQSNKTFTSYTPDITISAVEENIQMEKDDGILRIAVILPVEAQNPQAAEDLKNAATMALFDAKSENTILQFYNSNGTYEDAKEKVHNAISEGADVIVGPLFADEVKGAKSAVDDTPIISFTTDTNVLSRNVFSIGFLMEQQIKRIVEFAVQNGITKFGVIVSDSDSGNFVLDNFKKYVSAYNAEVVAENKYTTKKKNDLMAAVKEISDFDNRVNEYNEYKKAAKERFDYLVKLKDENPDEYAVAYDLEQYFSTDDEVSFLEKTLEDLEKQTTISDPEYEAIFVFGDDINDVLMIGSSLMYYDVHPDRIKYLGTSQLENSKIYTERAFRGAWYPSVSTKYTGQFDNAYRNYFKRKPIKIASLAYDAVSLVNSLEKDGVIEKDDLLNPNGWTGINGSFRFKSNGASERNMDIKEIVGGSVTKTKVISPAPVNFLN